MTIAAIHGQCPHCMRSEQPMPSKSDSIDWLYANYTDELLTANILRNWPRDKVVRFAKHLLGETCQKCESV